MKRAVLKGILIGSLLRVIMICRGLGVAGDQPMAFLGAVLIAMGLLRALLWGRKWES